MEDLMRVALAALAIGFGWYKLLEIGEASSTRVKWVVRSIPFVLLIIFGATLPFWFVR